MALYSGKRWVNEPGKKWDWSISGFQLLVTILERVTGQSYEDYVQQNILSPAGVKSTSYCDDFTLTPGLSHSYRKVGNSYVMARENDMFVTATFHGRQKETRGLRALATGFRRLKRKNPYDDC
jgi:CubicO group peptidase (beta-lactamase class C family)